MRLTRLLLITLFLTNLAVPAFAQVTDTYVVAAAGKMQGQNGTRWLTQFSLFNPHLNYPLFVSVTFLPKGGAQGIERLIELPANATYITDDVLADVFNLNNGEGALLVATFAEDNPGVEDSVLARGFLVTSNTYNNATAGTYGQTIPGVWTGLLDYEFDQISSVSHGIDNSTRLNFRTNVGAVNLGRCNITVHVSVYDADGETILDEAPMVVPPLAHWQQALPVEVEGGSVEFFVFDGCYADDELYAVVFPYTSTIDNRSGDPKFQTPSLLASPGLIYGKGKVIADPTQLGKRIDSSYALGVRESARRLGTATLVRGERGWQVAK